MNTLDEILEEWDKDSVVDGNQPGKELVEVPKLHAKYLRVLVKNRLLLKKTIDDIAVEKKIKYNYYSGNYNTDKAKLAELGLEPFKFIIKQDIGIYLDSDDGLLKLKSRKAIYEEKVAACEMIIKELGSRTYQLRDQIAWIKFESGS